MTIRAAALAVAGLALLAIPLTMAEAKAEARPVAQTIYVNADIATMDPDKPTARALAIGSDGKFIDVGSPSGMQRYVGPDTQTVDLGGATVLPGFIDPHSHFLGYAFYINPRWIDVSNVNVYFKPLPGDPRCLDRRNPQLCFIPVRTQDDVMRRLEKEAAAQASKPVPERGVYAFNYDASRLGHGDSCSGHDTNVGFRCPSLEDGQARTTLDAISTEFPIYVGGESGHIGYANSAALMALNICGLPGATADCRPARTYPDRQIEMAKEGQLVEDLALYADGYFDGVILKEDEAVVLAAIVNGIATYANHGFTLLQEGAASKGDAELYKKLVDIDSKLPVTVALYMYDTDERRDDFSKTVRMARLTKRLLKDTPDVFVAGLKTFVDGGLPVYTAQLNRPYLEVFPPFNGPDFPQPYKGLSDITLAQLKARMMAAHQEGYPLLIHELGDHSAELVARAMEEVAAEAPSPYRDIMLHGPLVSSKVLDTLKTLGRPISFLTQDLYFWGQPLCNQIMGANLLNRLPPYPANSAKKRGLTVTMHTDSPVTPPSPLFSIWVAKTRSVQQMPWYPNRNPDCKPVNTPAESLSIAAGIEAFTSAAADQYGLLAERGTITPGKVADLVFLSANPLAMEDTPDDLKTIRVLGTVHDGTFRANPESNDTPIWPGDL